MTREDLNSTIGKRLALRRRELDLTLAQVAERCGVSLQQVHKYETGQTSISAAMLVQLARCLQVPVGRLLEELEG
ncbi:helix-turn-helix transcriptional regulator [uncultured Phenylobacterium sp.]|uniref:helix-turn-helix domain-containing protein n=1 Tax=uncultured Phenylobacterium sp. TaxID=349273 RepID=UPI0025CC2C90|nr:helix-turn-helix transcriptional regulator [uncultured Phenylobacterium sp.]